jgi:hypothetical protein
MSIANQLQDMGTVPKYEIEEDKYKAREDTFARFKEKNPQLFVPKAPVDDNLESDKAAAIQVSPRPDLGSPDSVAR